MKTKKQTESIAVIAVFVAFTIANLSPAHAQTNGAKSPGGNSTPASQWSVQVERIDPGDTAMASSFQFAIYENLLEEVSKSRQFRQVFRDGDRHAHDVADLLILKTTVEKYTPGSETRRAVTTVSGATKITVHAQLCTRNGQVLLENKVDGNVRFFGNNLRATHNLSRNIVKTIKKSQWQAPAQTASAAIDNHQSQLSTR